MLPTADIYHTSYSPIHRAKSPSISAQSIVTLNRPDWKRRSSYLLGPDPPQAHLESGIDAQLGLHTQPHLGFNISAGGANRSPAPGHTLFSPNHPVSDGVANVNRWSNSTSSTSNLRSPAEQSTAGDFDSPSSRDRRTMSFGQSHSVKRDELPPRTVSQPRGPSPMQGAAQRHPSLDAQSAPANPLASLHIPNASIGSIASPCDSDIMLTATSFSPSSAGLLTPLSYSSYEYFGNGPAGPGASKRDGSSSGRMPRQSPPRPISQKGSNHRHHPSSSIEELQPNEQARKRPKTRERREQDKKTMLAKALEQANTAVQLDNAMNYDGALSAYNDACRLLQSVMSRTTGADDKRKLDAIRETYAIRVEELLQLRPVNTYTLDEKRLPPRPPGIHSPVSQTLRDTMKDEEKEDSDRESAIIQTATMTRILEAPTRPPPVPHRSPPQPHRSPPVPRRSFLTDAIHEVEGSSPGAFLGPLWEKSKSPFRESSLSDRTAREDDQTYMPRPLTAKRSDSPDLQDRATDDADSAIMAPVELPGDIPDEHSDIQSTDSHSWLDTVDESANSDDSSMHARTDEFTLQRRNISERSGSLDESELDFDAAFDAAVEAAYEDGYMPDTEAVRPKTSEKMTRYALESEKTPRPNNTFGYSNVLDDAEEERILDDLTRFSADHGFSFDMNQDPMLPRQSDSSLLSRDTWQSSVESNRTTAGTSLSVADRSLLPDIKDHEFMTASAALDVSSSPLLQEQASAAASSRPLSVISEGSRSVQDRRIIGANRKNLKIETAVEPWSSKLPVVDDEGAINGDGTLQVHRIDSTAQIKSADPKSPRPRLFRKNKSAMSLRDNSKLFVDETEPMPKSPLSAVDMADGQQNVRRPTIVPSGGSYLTLRERPYSTTQLFDTSISIDAGQTQSPQSANTMSALPLEPCPESALLRPFWLLRNISTSVTHPRGGFLTNRLFVSREVWQTRNVKLKNIDEKIAHCDLLTAALGKLANVDTYDADAVLEELQAFEEVMERVQTMMVKRLGSEVGVHGIGAMFKDAVTTEGGNVITEGRDGPKSNSGKSYLSGWRKLRSKNSGHGGTSGGALATGVRPEREGTTMASVPMTSFVAIDKRTAHALKSPSEAGLEGPYKEYMASLARLCEAAQVLGKQHFASFSLRFPVPEC